MKKEIHCPYCGSRLLDSECGVLTLTKVMNPNDFGSPPKRWVPDYVIKCWRCKKKIGLKKVDNN